MPDFRISFIVPARSLGETLIALHPFKISQLETHIVVTKGATGKKGGMTAVQTIADYVNKSKTPVTPKEAADVIEAAGFKRSGASTHTKDAIKRKLIRRTAAGYVGVSTR